MSVAIGQVAEQLGGGAELQLFFYDIVPPSAFVEGVIKISLELFGVVDQKLLSALAFLQ